MGKIATEAEAAKIGGMPVPSTGNKVAHGKEQ